MKPYSPSMVEIFAKKAEEYGRISCGGDGASINPNTGERWGEAWFKLAEDIRNLAEESTK